MKDQRRPSGSEVVGEEWNAFVRFVVPWFFDLVKGLMIFGALLVFAWALNLGQKLGVQKEHLDAFGSAHFWLSFSAFVILGLTFLLRLVYSVFKR